MKGIPLNVHYRCRKARELVQQEQEDTAFRQCIHSIESPCPAGPRIQWDMLVNLRELQNTLPEESMGIVS